MKTLLEKVEGVLKHMRWRAFSFMNKDDSVSSDIDSSENEDYGFYGFKSKKTPPQIEEIAQFEKGILDVVENVEFQKVTG